MKVRSKIQILRNFQINSNSLFCDFRTKQVDEFTARLLEIHAKMMAVNKKEVINLVCC